MLLQLKTQYCEPVVYYIHLTLKTVRYTVHMICNRYNHNNYKKLTKLCSLDTFTISCTYTLTG